VVCQKQFVVCERVHACNDIDSARAKHEEATMTFLWFKNIQVCDIEFFY
jgi:hypothetical protein